MRCKKSSKKLSSRFHDFLKCFSRAKDRKQTHVESHKANSHKKAVGDTVKAGE